jgi:FlaA1/EpsC-like NDP-sugar epimerase
MAGSNGAGGVFESSDAADLLRRTENVRVRDSVRSMIAGRRVLITGAGGSIGSELARQVHALGPAQLTLVDRDDSLLHGICLDLVGDGLFEDGMAVLADIRDLDRLHTVFDEYRPEIVLHAAALKHLSLLEQSPAEAVKTNVRGTHNVLLAAQRAGVERFVLVSTDKAADPVSVLGATKRLAELLLPLFSDSLMRVSAVRFGNVLGSRGSLLTSIATQARRGQAITITDPDATRFFMTIPEACTLVLEAGEMGRSAETFVLDMGEPVRILDLVLQYLREEGYPDATVRITGLRSGEKAHEVVLSRSEDERPTPHERIMVTSVQDVWAESANDLPALYRAADLGDDRMVRELLMSIVAEYAPRIVARR